MPAGVWERECLEVLSPHAVRAGGCASRLKADDAADWERRGRVERRELPQRAREWRLAIWKLSVHLRAHSRVIGVSDSLACEEPRCFRKAEAPHKANSALDLPLLVALVRIEARAQQGAVVLPPVDQALEVTLGKGSEASWQDRMAPPSSPHWRSEHDLAEEAPELEPPRRVRLVALPPCCHGAAQHRRCGSSELDLELHRYVLDRGERVEEHLVPWDVVHLLDAMRGRAVRRHRRHGRSGALLCCGGLCGCGCCGCCGRGCGCCGCCGCCGRCCTCLGLLLLLLLLLLLARVVGCIRGRLCSAACCLRTTRPPRVRLHARERGLLLIDVHDPVRDHIIRWPLGLISGLLRLLELRELATRPVEMRRAALVCGRAVWRGGVAGTRPACVWAWPVKHLHKRRPGGRVVPCRDHQAGLVGRTEDELSHPCRIARQVASLVLMDKEHKPPARGSHLRRCRVQWLA